MNSKKNILLYDLQTWEVYNSHILPSDEIVIWTSNPSVIEKLSEKYVVNDISRDLSKDYLIKIGNIIQSVSKIWKEVLNLHFSEKLLLNKTGLYLGRGLPQLLSSVVYAYECLRELPRDVTFIVPYLANFSYNKLNIKETDHLTHIKTNYFGLIAQSFLDNKKFKPFPLFKNKEIKINTKKKFSSFYVKLLEIGLILSARVDILFSRAINIFLEKMCKKDIPLRKLNKKEIIIYIPSLPIFRLVPLFWFKGHRISIIKKNLIKNQTNEVAKHLSDLEEILINKTNHFFNNSLFSIKSSVWRIAARRIINYLNYTFIPTAENLINELKKINKNDQNKSIFLSNTIAQPIELLIASAYRKAGAEIVCFQHGTTGLLKHYETMQLYTDFVYADRIVAFSQYEKDFYRELTSDNKKPVFIQGAWVWKKIRFKKLARWISRKLWEIKKSEKIVLYAPTRFKDGHIWLPYSIKDSNYWNFIKETLFECISNSNINCYVKIHQKGLNQKLSRGKYDGRVHPLEICKLPPNIFLKYWPDLTYSRNAADIILIDRATSTFNWAFATSKPLIYLENNFNPLIPKVRKIMEKAIFVIDTNEENWKKNLQEILNMPYPDLLIEWEKKSENRKILGEYFLMGPKKPSLLELINWLEN